MAAKRAEFVFEIDPVELACRIFEAGIEMKRPLGTTAAEAWHQVEETDPTGAGAAARQARAAAVDRCDVVICAWGAHPFASRNSNFAVGIFKARKPQVYCLGTTKHGHPKHPLYIKTGTVLEAYRP